MSRLYELIQLFDVKFGPPPDDAPLEIRQLYDEYKRRKDEKITSDLTKIINLNQTIKN